MMAHRELDGALQFLTAALKELDENGGPAEIGAAVDLAICQLRAFMDGEDGELAFPADFGRGAGVDAPN